MIYNKINFTIIIPAYNEGKRLATFLPQLVNAIKHAGLNTEILIIDDGGTEADSQSYNNLLNTLNGISIRCIKHIKNQGKGAAVITGFNNAQGEWVGFVDADGATPADEIIRIMKIALSSPQFDGIFGSRIRMLGYTVDRSLRRHLMGRIFVTLFNALFHIPVYDTQCGCKFFRLTKISSFLNICQEKGYLIDIEFIILGNQKQLKFLEVPIHWYDQPDSKINGFMDPIKMALDLFKMKKRLKIQ